VAREGQQQKEVGVALGENILCAGEGLPKMHMQT
jgi:hypothetical protein